MNNSEVPVIIKKSNLGLNFYKITVKNYVKIW